MCAYICETTLTCDHSFSATNMTMITANPRIDAAIIKARWSYYEIKKQTYREEPLRQISKKQPTTKLRAYSDP